MLHQASVPSGYMGNSQSMEDYMKESSMKYLKLWPSEAGIIVTAQCLKWHYLHMHHTHGLSYNPAVPTTMKLFIYTRLYNVTYGHTFDFIYVAYVHCRSDQR